VVKNIIPAVASTNAIIAAACVTEAWKYITKASMLLDNYQFYNGASLAGCNTVSYVKKADCKVCRMPEAVVEVASQTTLQQLRDQLTVQLNVPNPALTTRSKGLLYAPKLHGMYEHNLSVAASQLIDNGQQVMVTNEEVSRLVIVVFA